MRDWARSFTDVTREHGFEPLRVEGRLPDALRGTYFRNGPGLVTSFGEPYRHWFDGDGLVSAVRYDGGKAEGGARLLQTKGLLEERQRGQRYFGSFGTKPPGLWNPWRMLRSMRGDAKNPANTALLNWGERVFGLCEIGRPFEFDPATLSSIGESDLGGVVPGAFSAHPHRIAKTDTQFNIGTRIGRPNAIDVFRMRPDGTAGQVTQIPLAYPTLIHDFAATPRFLVIFVAPLRLKLLPTLFGRASFADSLEWDASQGTEVLIVPLDAPRSVRRFSVDPFWTWHVGNAFEDGDRIVMDVIRYRDFPSSQRWLGSIAQGGPTEDADGVLTRFSIDPARESLDAEVLVEGTSEFPRVAPHVDGARHSSVYCAQHSSVAAGRHGPPDAVARVDLDGTRDRFVFPKGHYPSEAVFSPRGAGETDGWLHTLVYDAGTHTSYFAVLDAAHVADGPIATAHLDHHIPLSFHGAWRSA
ncbi:MAG: carotenoid oxygenase family protein [Sandaracinaceae bacterium]